MLFELGGEPRGENGPRYGDLPASRPTVTPGAVKPRPHDEQGAWPCLSLSEYVTSRGAGHSCFAQREGLAAARE